jgi:tetratricopeptide (TPR) repeat protein
MVIGRPWRTAAIRGGNLSVAYKGIGEVLMAQGKLDEALKAYRDSLAICPFNLLQPGVGHE